jgi:hypothetical protein
LIDIRFGKFEGFLGPLRNVVVLKSGGIEVVFRVEGTSDVSNCVPCSVSVGLESCYKLIIAYERGSSSILVYHGVPNGVKVSNTVL